MIYIFLIFSLVFSCAHAVTIETDTHIYTTERGHHKLTVIDKLIQDQYAIDLPFHAHCLTHYKGYLYAGNWTNSAVAIIDLSTHTHINTVDLQLPGTCELYCYKNKLYGLDCLHAQIAIFDLEHQKIDRILDVPGLPNQMVFYNDVAFIPAYSGHCIYILNLLTKTLTKTIPTEQYPSKLYVHNDLGYVLHEGWSTFITVIDLMAQNILKNIVLMNTPTSMVIHPPFGYVIDKDVKDKTNMTVIDLKTNRVSHKIDVPWCQTMAIHDGFLFVSLHAHTILVIDLDKRKVIGNVSVRSDREILFGAYLRTNMKQLHFSRAHIYGDGERLSPGYPAKADIKQGALQKDISLLLPEPYTLGHIYRRQIPVVDTVFDDLPPYILMDEIAGFLSPEDMLALLVTIKNPNRLINTDHGQLVLMPALYYRLALALWMRDSETIETMLTYFIHLNDPLITPHVTFKYVKRPPPPNTGYVFPQLWQDLVVGTVTLSCLLYKGYEAVAKRKA